MIMRTLHKYCQEASF